jgi:hypothetical protein
MQQAWLGIPLLLSSRAAEDAAAVAPASLPHYLQHDNHKKGLPLPFCC